MSRRWRIASFDGVVGCVGHLLDRIYLMEENSALDRDALRHRELQRQKDVVLVVWGGLCFVQGFSSYFLPYYPELSQTVGYLWMFVSLFPYGRWFLLDAKQHHFQFTRTQFIVLLVMGILIVPYYFLKTRRSGVWRTLLGFVLLFVLAMVLAMVGAILAYLLSLGYWYVRREG
jgi:hypothetical protein